jgi:type I site-specific restriction endonuclease
VHETKRQIFDEIRKKYVQLTPEEWVRQHLIKYIITEKNFPPGLIAVEKKVEYNGINKRADVVVYNKEGKPFLIAECKAPSVNITEAAFQQAVAYNYTLQAKYIVLTNGMQHFFASIDYAKKQLLILTDILPYTEL